MDILDKLAQRRTIDYFKTDLNLTEIQNELIIKEVKSIELLDITTLISLGGELSGTIAMSVSHNLSKLMVKNFIYGKVDEETISQLAAENVAETLNITLGNIIQDLDISKNGWKSRDLYTLYYAQSSWHNKKR